MAKAAVGEEHIGSLCCGHTQVGILSKTLNGSLHMSAIGRASMITHMYYTSVCKCSVGFCLELQDWHFHVHTAAQSRAGL